MDISELNFTTDTLIQIINTDGEVGKELFQQVKEQVAESEAKIQMLADEAIAKFTAASEETQAKLTALIEKLTPVEPPTPQEPQEPQEGEPPVDELPSEEEPVSAA
jgi:uncharacterized protein YlzI (FlbEa/FlbD family)